MSSCKKIRYLLACILFSTGAFAQDNLQFIENKGQWDPQIKFKGDMAAGAFVLQATGYRVLMHNQNDINRLGESVHHAPKVDASSATGKIGFFPEKVESPSVTLRSHVYEMKFLNANKDPQIVPDKPLATYSNYFIGNDSSKWASNCKTYQGITYKNVYPNIDVRYYTSSGTLKYDFIIHPGGDPSAIAMYFDGAESLKIKDGSLIVKTSVDEVKEETPYTYQLIDDKRMEIPCSYELKGNIVRFKLDGAYSKTSTLVIDPSLVFSTFTGSTADNWGYTATYDGRGNFYAGGIVFGGGNTKFPVSNGAFQQTYQGGSAATGERNGFDMAIMKFNASGTNREYATYLGGTTGNEQPHSLVVDGAGNLVIAGRSTSSDYPTAGALKTYGSLGGTGLWHIVVTKLNANGTGLIGSVRIGGKAQDGVNINHKYMMTAAESINRNYGDDARSEVVLDAQNNVYFVSCTQSTDFPVTAVSAQTTTGGANAKGRSQDAVLLKLTPDLSSVLFSVIFGGKDDDAAFVMAINPSTNNLFIAGATASTDLPGSKTGVKYPTFQGGLSDGFVAEFTNNGALVRSSYFGTTGNDQIYGIQFDKFSIPYIAGTTSGSWPVVNSNFIQPGKQFISKLQPDLSDFVYSTTFGNNSSNPNISPTAFLVDRCENVYVSGWGGVANIEDGYPNSGTNGLSVTGDAFQKTTDNSDFYFFVLEKNAKSQLYGSFFGQVGGFGEHVDGGTSRFDRNGVIYQSLCANCSSPKPRFPTTPGVWAPNNGSSGCNLAAVKIAFNLAGVGAGIQASVNGVIHDTSGCVPLPVVFTDTLAQGKQYLWDFNDGSAQVTTTDPTVSHTFNTNGLFRVRLVAVDSSSCNISDTTFVTMRVRDDQANLAFTATKLPPCTSLAYEFNNTTTAIKPFKSNSFIWDFGDGTKQVAGIGIVTHTYSTPGTYDVKLTLVDTNYCNEPDSLVKQIRIATNVKAQFTTPASGCVAYNALFTNTSLAGQSFTWNFGDGSAVSTQTNPTHLYSNIGTYTIRLTAVDSGTCNKIDSTSFTITVNDNPNSSYVYTPQPTQPNEPIVFQNTSSGAIRYKWIFGDDDTLNTIAHDTTVVHLYNATGTFNACLVSYNASGCTDTACQAISAVVVPGVDVPNAFSPNGDGRNDRIYARGNGITKMTWRIYNRWGAVVYLGTDIAEGWDGTYKGKLQAQDVYHYTLDVEFSSHDKVSKKGDITLLR